MKSSLYELTFRKEACIIFLKNVEGSTYSMEEKDTLREGEFLTDGEVLALAEEILEEYIDAFLELAK